MSKIINNKKTDVNKKFVLKTKTKNIPPSNRAGHSYISSSSGLINYVIGGYSNDEVFTDIFKYDNNIWSKISELTSYTTTNTNPFPRMEFDCCCLGDNIYLFAGMQFEAEQVLILNDLWMFDVIKLKWNLIHEETPVSERVGHVMIAINDYSFIIYGGECMRKPCNDMWLYTINTTNVGKSVESSNSYSNGVWTRVGIHGDQPVGRTSHSSVFNKETNKLVLFGGISVESSSTTSNDINHLNDIWVMDMNDSDCSKWRWSMLNVEGLAPSPRDLPGIASYGVGKILIMGGFGFQECLDDDDDDDDNIDEQIDEAVINMEDIMIQNNICENDNMNDLIDSNEQVNAIIVSKNTENSNIVNEDKYNDNNKKVSFSNDLDSNEDNNDNEDNGENEIELTYLSDCFIIDLVNLSSSEVDLEEIVQEEKNKNSKNNKINKNTNNLISSARRGTKLIVANDNIIKLFGGFNGELFTGEIPNLDIKKLESTTVFFPELESEI